MNILFITNIPSPYTVSFLNELGKLAKVHALFERRNSIERDSSWEKFSSKYFSYNILHGYQYSVDKSFCIGVLKYIRKYRKWRIILSNPMTATGILSIAYMKMANIPFSLQIEGGFPKTGFGVKEKLKKLIIKGASYYYSSGESTNKYLLHYGADATKIGLYPFTSLYESDILLQPLNKDEQSQLREKLGIHGKFVVLAIGQFIPRKGFDILLRSLKYCVKSIDVCIIGGTPTAEYLSLCKELALDNVKFLPFTPKTAIYQWMCAADVFVMPTRYDIWGLVVNEAMAHGLPVISSDMCVAACEMIKPGVNGFIFRNENHRDLAEYISILYEKRSLLESMRLNSLEVARKYTYEKMAEAHIGVW